MSTFFLKNPHTASEFIVADDAKLCQHNDMDEKKRGQIRINFGDAKVLEAFYREVKLREDKPGRMATQILRWWLKQPRYAKDWAYLGTQLPANAEEEIKGGYSASRSTGRGD